MTFNLGVLHQSQPHLFADLAELILAVGYDNIDELSQVKLSHLSKETPIDLDEQQTISDVVIEDCWSQLEYRQAVFNEFYPFNVQADKLSWKPKITNKHQLYLFLLVCSRLRSFENNGFRQQAAKVFAQICRNALKTLSGEQMIVRIFDANSDDRKNHYGTDLRKAMFVLAKEMGASFINESAINKLSSSGDYGIDLVAIHNFNDGAIGSYNIIAQCGAQETEWPSKIFDAHPKKLIGLFTLLNEPDNLMFIPLSYRDTTGAWVNETKISGCLLLDRYRILQLLKQNYSDIEALYLPLLSKVLKQHQ